MQIIPTMTKTHLIVVLSASRPKPITRSATVPIQKISTNVAIPGFCFSGIQRRVTNIPVAIMALPNESVVFIEIPS